MRKIKGLRNSLFPGRAREEAENLSPPPHERGFASFGKTILQAVRDGFCRIAARGRRSFSSRRALLLPKSLHTRPYLLIICAVLLICLCAILVWWGRNRHSASADFNLHTENSCSNLDNISAEDAAPAANAPSQPTVVVSDQAAPLPEPPVMNVTELPPPPVVQVVRTDNQGIGTPLPPPQAMDQPPDVPPPSKFEFPAPAPLQLTEPAPVDALPPPSKPLELDASDPLEDWHRGDVPMIRNWHKILGYQALLAGALFAGTAGADDKNTDQPSKAELKAIRDLLDGIDKKIGSLDSIKSDVGGLKKEMELMRQANTGAFNEVHRRISELEKRLSALESKANQTTTRIANAPPTNGAAPPMGRVRLLNNFPSPASVRLNNMVYRLGPFETQFADVPLGQYTYEVWIDGFGSVQPPTVRTLLANAPSTIEIYMR
jgi:hypothetical protein